MPIDKNGNRAEVITDNGSTISRMNIGRTYEAYLGALSRDNKQRLMSHFVNKYGDNFIGSINSDDLSFFKDYIRGLYSIINVDMVEFIDSLTPDELFNHLKEVIFDNLYLYYPTDNENNICDVIEAFEGTPYKPTMDKVTYVDDLGNRVETVEDVRIGQLYIMVLEKIANTYSAVSSSKVNNFGFPIKGTNVDKTRYPHSLTPTKTLGETEVRILTSFASPELVADLIDITLNPISHKLLVKGILEGDASFNKSFNIDRSVVEYGQTRSLMILKHISNAFGFDFTYEENK